MKKQIKIPLILITLAILSSIIHNIIYAIFKFEEPIFFLLSLILFLAFIISIIYYITIWLKNKFK